MKRIKINKGPEISGYWLRIEDESYDLDTFEVILPDIIDLRINRELAMTILDTPKGE